jgi:predicted nuclease of predicted toxin-antitoxin system
VKFLTDQDVYGGTVRFLRSLGHEVETASELGLAQADDAVLLSTAQSLGKILVTRDRDFGGLVFGHGLPAGIIYLRILPSAVSSVHTELERSLSLYEELDLSKSLVVVEPGRHRIRRIGPNRANP